MRNVTQTPPVIKVTQQQLECVKCGARSHATCSCGVDYKPVAQRVSEYDQANPGQSARRVAAETGADRETVKRVRERGGMPPPETVIGRDGKEYPASRPPMPKTAVMVEHDITQKLGNELIGAGYKAMAAQFSYDQATLARLKQVRDNLHSHVNNPVEWF
jgi:hypothetical protein